MGDPREPIGAFRAILIAVCAILSVLPPQRPQTLLVLLVLALGAWGAYRRPSFAAPWPYAASALTGLFVPWSGGSSSPLLPYLLAGGLSLGLTRGPRELILAGVAAALAILAGTALPDVAQDDDLLRVAAEWLLLALALGLVAAWARRLAVPPDRRDDYLQVRDLLEQLQALTRHLPGGLDAPNAAAALLDRCTRLVPQIRAGVLVQPTGGAFVPLAVRGAQRVPWRDPLRQAGPLRQAWESGRAVLEVRGPDKVGRREGGALLAVPLLSTDGPFGLVVLEARSLDVFTEAVRAEVERLVLEAAVQLETAMIFEEVQLQASTEERDRLAKAMHDGVAQELAFVGYRLDDLRQRAATVDPALAASVSEVRRDLTALISDIRLSITDLKTSVRPDRSLGAALSSYLHAVCSGKKVLLNLSLQETAFRLPADQEVALFKSAQLFAQEVRRSADVQELTVVLVIDPPSARLHMSCDGAFKVTDLGDLGPLLGRIGADVTISQDGHRGPCLEIELSGGVEDEERAAGR